ncbi:polysaccharide biosynthesis C-terminal domain-containing protein [Ruminococcaceae bacterium OttesenSCG-928-D13]|nr:polysaccharide biosynthesis C-terminal domain-containing protein [Ruminococcaceae bacterium OttesenSCG-928-D13]
MRKKGDKYTRLVSNTMLFGISTFSSKVLSFLLTRLYTSVLAQASFGVVNLVTISANLLIPLVSLGISNAVIRFGLEKNVSKDGVFTGGLVSIGFGFGLMVLLYPLISRVPMVSDYSFLLYIYVLVSCLRTLCCQFVRAKMYTRLYAIDGILSTIYTIGFNLLFLVVLKLGPTGYLLSIICADALSVIGLNLVAVLPQYISFRRFDWTLYKAMLRYCLPLVPALMFWWITSSSDQFFISYISGPEANGLYAAAYKVPTVVSIFSTIFTEAWQLSAVTDGQDAERDRFFSNIFSALSGVSFIIGGALIYGCRLIMRFLVAEDYFDAWLYIPFLVVAIVFSTMVSFLNSIYMVEKKSGRSLVTMLIGALSNIVMNWFFIRWWGPSGAALATFFSYAIIFIIRALDTRQFIKIDFAPWKLLASTTLLCALSFIMVAQVKMWQFWCAIPMALLLALNATSLYKGVMQVLHKRLKRA